MILDHGNRYSDKQAVTATAPSTNVIDHGAGKYVGLARGGAPDLRVMLQVPVAFNNLTSLTVEFQESDTEGAGYATVGSTVLLAAALTAGAKFPMRFPPMTDKRYSRLNYVVAGTPPTTGQIDAALILDEQDWVAPAAARY